MLQINSFAASAAITTNNCYFFNHIMQWHISRSVITVSLYWVIDRPTMQLRVLQQDTIASQHCDAA